MQAFSKLHLETPKEFTQLIKGGIFKQLTKTARTSRKNAQKTVFFEWTAVPWNTHRATNKRTGMWTSSDGHVFDWNEDL
jgi:hypothetical protein